MYPTYTATAYVPIQIPYPICDPSNPYCNGYYPPGYAPPQNPNPWCYAGDPYCNAYPPAQTVTASPPAPQTVVVTQPIPQTVMVTQAPPQTVVVTQPVPQPVEVTQPQGPDYAIIALAIIAAAAVGMLLMSRRPSAAGSAQPGQAQSSAYAQSATQPGLQFCTTCGRQVALNSRFCGHCGSAQ